jgi:hypothetical protein
MPRSGDGQNPEDPMTHPTRTAAAWTAAIVASALLATSCTASITASTPARARVYSYPVVVVDGPPPRFDDSARVVYRGRPAYLVGSRWYYPSNDGWVYFAEEPPELRQQRRTFTRVRPRQTPRRYADPPGETRRYVESPRESRQRRYVR